MGAFCGSVQLKTEDREAVRIALEELAAKGRLKFLVSPCLRGWLGVYPSGGGQDEALAGTLAARFKCPVLGLSVHDDDVFSYRFFLEGRAVDEYKSLPDYFGEVSAKERERLGGKPEVFKAVLPSSGKIAELKAVLSSRPVFASESLRDFAALLGIANTLTSYEYLREGETEEIEGWKEFLHVPDLAAENLKKKAEAKKIVEEKRRLKKEGRLLYEAEGKPAGPFSTQPFVCPDPQSGFFVCWTDLMNMGSYPLERVGPPWESPESAGISLAPNAHALALSPSGRYLAAGGAKAQLWEVKEKRLIFEAPHSNAVTSVFFSADEKSLISKGATEINISAVDAGGIWARVRTQPAGGPDPVALHPSGKTLVALERGNLSIFELPSGSELKSLCVGRKQDFGFLRALLLPKIKESIEKMQAKDIEEKVRKLLGTEDPEAKKLAGKFFEDLKKVGSEWGSAGLVRGTESPAALKFTADGRLLVCATSKGLRVYAWDQVLAAREETPAPLFSADSEFGYVYALALDENAGRVFFAGQGGRVGSMDLSNGKSDTVLEVPGRPAVLKMALARDRSALALVCLPGSAARGAERRPAVLYIWTV